MRARNNSSSSSTVATPASLFRSILLSFALLSLCLYRSHGFRLRSSLSSTTQLKVVSCGHPINQFRSTGIVPCQHQKYTNKLLPPPQRSHATSRQGRSASVIFSTHDDLSLSGPSSSSLYLTTGTATGTATANDAAIKDSLPAVSSLLPRHKGLITGKLPNGLEYFILPNAVPGQRFEAHLEVLSGSVFEQEDQQGMAHLAEHVTYMGSPKRQLIAGTGSRTNAYTDFHHTVFFCGCPIESPDNPFWSTPMLPMAFDALIDVMSTTVREDRLEKERAAVLSEASMINTIDYRVECQILTALHAGNRLSRRFPIGKEELIKKWTKNDLQKYIDTHYTPDNSVLYIVGDLNVEETVKTIESKFSKLVPSWQKIDTGNAACSGGSSSSSSISVSCSDSNEVQSLRSSTDTVRATNRHFPPVIHKWTQSRSRSSSSSSSSDDGNGGSGSGSGSGDSYVQESDKSSPVTIVSEPIITKGDTTTDTIEHPVSSSSTVVPIVPIVPPPLVRELEVFSHPLLKRFSFHLFAKRPIDPIVDLASLKRELQRKIVLCALQVRLNVHQRQDPLYTKIDFNQHNWPREGCAVCGLDFSTDWLKWPKAVQYAIREVRRLGLFGLTEGEFTRFRQSFRNDAWQAAMESSRLDNENVLAQLMESVQCGHVYMDADSKLQAVDMLLNKLTLEEVNGMAASMCEHLSAADPTNGVNPCAAVACIPEAVPEGEGEELQEIGKREVQSQLDSEMEMEMEQRALCSDLSTLPVHVTPEQPLPLPTSSSSSSSSFSALPQYPSLSELGDNGAHENRLLSSALPSSLKCTKETLAQVIESAMLEPLEPLHDTPIPTTLISNSEMQSKIDASKPDWMLAPLQVTASEPVMGSSSLYTAALSSTAPIAVSDTGRSSTQQIQERPPLGTVQRVLSNGMAVNMKTMQEEPGRFMLRLLLKGGRMYEDGILNKIGSILVGSKTIQEGGATSKHGREEVELFCIDQQVMVEVGVSAEAVTIDLSTVISPANSTPHGQPFSNSPSFSPSSSSSSSSSSSAVVSNTEALFQVAHLILTDFIYEEDALQRAKQSLTEEREFSNTNIELVATNELMEALINRSLATTTTTTVSYQQDTGSDGDRNMDKSRHGGWVAAEEVDREEVVDHRISSKFKPFVEEKELNDLTLDDIRSTMTRLLVPTNVEATLVGDLSENDMKSFSLRYLGTVPVPSLISDNSADSSDSEQQPRSSIMWHRPTDTDYHPRLASNSPSTPSTPSSSSSSSSSPLSSNHVTAASTAVAATSSSSKSSLGSRPLSTSSVVLHVSVPDSEPRAVGYISGAAPNWYGLLRGGASIVDRMEEIQRHEEQQKQERRREEPAGSFTTNTNTLEEERLVSSSSSSSLVSGALSRKEVHHHQQQQQKRRSHPLFANAAMLLLQEVASRRLFSVVREERRLTYDASFSLENGCSEALTGGWYLVSVTSTPQQVHSALQACKAALYSLTLPTGGVGGGGVHEDSLAGSKQNILNHMQKDRGFLRHWVTVLGGTQWSKVPLKRTHFLADFDDVLKNVTVEDVRLLAKALKLDDSNSFIECVGSTEIQVSPPAAAAAAY